MIKKIVYSVTVVIVIMLITEFVTNASTNPLKSVSNFKIYYGEATPEAVQKLSQYEMVIIEPHAYTKEQVEEIRNSGTIVMGYISVMELITWNENFVQSLEETDYYLQNNKRFYVSDWDTYVMNIYQPHYRELLLGLIQEQVSLKGFDGIFLDTVGDIDDYFRNDPSELKKLRLGYLTLLKDLQKQHPHLLLFQNWGFHTYKETSYPLIDGLLWEDFDQKVVQKDKWSQNWIKYFKSQEAKGHLAVFTVAPDENGGKYSKKQGFVPYINKNSVYDDLINE